MSKDVLVPCIHNPKKNKIRVNYNGFEQTLEACNDCFEIIKLSSICKILEVYND